MGTVETTHGPKRIFREIPIERIRVSKWNPRHEPKDIDELAESIRSLGIVEPLLVAVDPADPEHVTLVAGYRRYTAAKRAGLATLPAVVTPLMSERQELAISLVENLHRRDLSPIEEGEAYEKLCQTGMRQDQVAAMCGTSEFTVSVRIRLAKELIPEARQAVHEGKLGVTEAYSLVRNPASVQRLLFLREREPKAKAPQGRKSHAHTALTRALSAHKRGDDAEALGLAEQAVEYLRKRVHRLEVAS